MRFFLEFLTKATLAVAFFSAAGAEGRVFIVTDTNDTTNITSLRGAIIAANSQAKDRNNIIILGTTESQRRNTNGSTFYLTIPGPDETNSLTGDLDITHGNLTIIGIGKNVTIDATSLGDRVFQVFSNASLTLCNLTITGGTAPQAQVGSFYQATLAAECGGAIYNSGVLILQSCVITNNSSGSGNYDPGNGGGSGGGDGGGIYNSGKMWMNNCIITGNSTSGGVDGSPGGNGGGIKNDGVGFFTASAIYSNSTGSGGGPAGNAFGFGGSGGDGGGIYNTGTLILNNCTISTNSCGSGSDGDQPGISWIFSEGGWGGAGGSGGGIFNVGKINLNFCTVNGNFAGNGGSGGICGVGGNAGVGGSGGGIFNLGTLNLNTCTISDNDCGNGGNGGYGYFNGGSSGDGGGGGGIFDNGSLNITSCTIVLNQTGTGGNGGNGNLGLSYLNNPSGASGGNGGSGGGIFNITNNSAYYCNGDGFFDFTNNSSIVLRNTLVALNSTSTGGLGGTNSYYSFSGTAQVGTPGNDGLGRDLSGVFTSQGFNLIGASDGSSGFTNAANADQVGSIATPINPLIGPLLMNGGQTPTHALLLGSPAIDQGKSFGLHTDQRSHPRPQDFSSIPNALGGDGSDIGAFELGSVAFGSPGTGGDGSHPTGRGGHPFQFQISAGQQQTIIQWSDDLVHWINIGSVTGTAVFTDTNAAAHPLGFYRKKP